MDVNFVLLVPSGILGQSFMDSSLSIWQNRQRFSNWDFQIFFQWLQPSNIIIMINICYEGWGPDRNGFPSNCRGQTGVRSSWAENCISLLQTEPGNFWLSDLVLSQSGFQDLVTREISHRCQLPHLLLLQKIFGDIRNRKIIQFFLSKIFLGICIAKLLRWHLCWNYHQS